jgi:hypothetical protein
MLALTSHAADADAANGANPDAVKQACVAKYEPQRQPWGHNLMALASRIDDKNAERGNRCRLLITFEELQKKLLASMQAEKACVNQYFPKLDHFITLREAGMSWTTTELAKCSSLVAK